MTKKNRKCELIMGLSSILKNEDGFQEWQEKNKFFGKRFSIIGDSISTFEGYNPQDYPLYYNEEKRLLSCVETVSDTWWKMLIDFFGAELLVNNSWSGCRVTKLPSRNDLFPSGCSDERTNGLHLGIMKPDVILIYMGANDWGYGALTGDETHAIDGDINELFYPAYQGMIDKIKKNYPQAEIFCFTLSTTYMSSCPEFRFPHRFGGKHIEAYNTIIKQVASSSGCGLVDLYRYGIPYDALDGTHPNKQGMLTLAKEAIRSIAGDEASKFIDCPHNSHEFVVTEEYAGGKKYTCRKCSKIRRENTLYGWIRSIAARRSK